ncbi:hypothetical protein PMAYCL1PPCAC_21476, partial [Pristionchus mayeri]
PFQDTKIILVPFFMAVLFLVYCSMTLPPVLMIIHNFTKPERGTSWFAFAYYISKGVTRFGYPGLAESEVFSKAWTYGICFYIICYAVWVTLV